MPKIEISIIMGYSNLLILLSNINTFDEFKTNKVEIRIKTLKKFENLSLIKLSKNIFSVLFGLFNIIAIVINIIIVVKLKTKLKLFFTKTPIIKIPKIDKVKKTSGNIIFKLKIICLLYLCSLLIVHNYLSNCPLTHLKFRLKALGKIQRKLQKKQVKLT